MIPLFLPCLYRAGAYRELDLCKMESFVLNVNYRAACLLARVFRMSPI